MNHTDFLKRAIELSEEKSQDGVGGPFGAVVVQNSQIIGEGWNAVTSENNPTLHAEIMAIENACKNLKTFNLSGCQIYSSSEPCPMCLGAIYWAHLDELYYSTTKKDSADIGFDDSFIYKEFKLLENERSIKTTHIDMPEAHKVFKKWQEKSDRITY